VAGAARHLYLMPAILSLLRDWRTCSSVTAIRWRNQNDSSSPVLAGRAAVAAAIRKLRDGSAFSASFCAIYPLTYMDDYRANIAAVLRVSRQRLRWLAAVCLRDRPSCTWRLLLAARRLFAPALLLSVLRLYNIPSLPSGDDVGDWPVGRTGVALWYGRETCIKYALPVRYEQIWAAARRMRMLGCASALWRRDIVRVWTWIQDMP